jgi:hypothetical protein
MCLSAHQHRTVYCEHTNGAKTDFFSVDLDSDRAEKIGTLDGYRALHVVSADDRRLGGSRLDTSSGFLWDIETKQEISAGRLESADGRWSLAPAYQGADNRRQIRIRPASGTEDGRPLVYVRGWPATLSVGPIPVSFSPDGEWVIYYDKDLDGKDSLYRVPTSGGEPVRLGDFPTSNVLSWLAINPNGRQFIVEWPKPAQQPEFWMFDNFIPKLSPAPKPASKAATK